MGFWLTLGVFFVSFLLYALLAPKPNFENAKAAELGDFRFPRSDEGTPVPIFWGRVRLRAPNTLWYGNLVATPITKRVKTGLFSKKTIIVGYSYSLTIALGWSLLTGSGITYRKLWFGEKEAWSGTAGGDASTFTVSAAELFGGKESGGGVSGDVDAYAGTFTQTVNSHLSGLVPDSTLLPAHRGLAYTVFKSFTVGESPTIRPISMEVEAIPNSLGLGAVGANGDANPCEIIYDVLQTEWGRLNMPSGEINGGTFSTAGGTLNTEGHGMSIKVENNISGRSFIEQVLEQIDGILYEDPLTQQLNMRLIRDDYVIGNLPVFDETNIVEVEEYSVSSWAETYNQSRVIYIDRNNLYEEKTAFAQDMANINFQGGKFKSLDFNYPGVKNGTLANSIAHREMNFLSLPLAKVRLKCDRSAATLIPGDPIVFAWEDYLITQMVLRVQKVDTGDLDNGTVTVYAFQDRFSVGNTLFADPSQTGWVAPDTSVSALTNYLSYEMPRWLNKQQIDGGAASGTDPDESYLQHLAIPDTSNADSFEAETSTDVGVSYDADLEGGQFTGSALLNAGVLISTAEVVAGASTFVLKNVSDTSLLVTGLTEANVLAGQNMLLIGDELIGYRNFTDNLDGTYTLNDVYRGLLDTSPRAHSTNDRVWFIDSVFGGSAGTGPFAGNETVRTRLIPYNSFTRLADASAPTTDITLQDRPERAYPPDGLTIDSTAHPTTIVNGVDTTVQLDWLRRDRLADPITSPAAADETGVEAGTTYWAEWEINAGGTNTQDMGNVNTYSLDLTGYGTITLRVYGRRNSVNSLYPVTRTFTFSAT